MFFNKILIAVDDSPPSQYAIQVGIAVAREDQSSVIFAVALDPTLLASDCAFMSVRELAEQIANGVIADTIHGDGTESPKPHQSLKFNPWQRASCRVNYYHEDESFTEPSRGVPGQFPARAVAMKRRPHRSGDHGIGINMKLFL